MNILTNDTSFVKKSFIIVLNPPKVSDRAKKERVSLSPDTFKYDACL